MYFFASGDTVSIVPTFRQFCACLSDGNGASFGTIARYSVSFRCRYTSYIASSLVEAAPGVHRPQARGSRLTCRSYRSCCVAAPNLSCRGLVLQLQPVPCLRNDAKPINKSLDESGLKQTNVGETAKD